MDDGISKAKAIAKGDLRLVKHETKTTKTQYHIFLPKTQECFNIITNDLPILTADNVMREVLKSTKII